MGRKGFDVRFRWPGGSEARRWVVAPKHFLLSTGGCCLARRSRSDDRAALTIDDACRRLLLSGHFAGETPFLFGCHVWSGITSALRVWGHTCAFAGKTVSGDQGHEGPLRNLLLHETRQPIPPRDERSQDLDSHFLQIVAGLIPHDRCYDRPSGGVTPLACSRLG